MQKHNKNGTELAFNTIIMAVILLIVAVVLILIFTGKMNFFNANTATCSSKGGSCLSIQENKCPEGQSILFTEDCKSADKKGGYGPCCIPLG